MRVGVLALQGAFALHRRALDALGVDPVEIRQPAHAEGLDALVLPGGESTTMSMLLERTGLFDPLAEAIDAGLPVLGTCAGMILLATEVLDGRADQRGFGAIDLTVRRNAYGRQLQSFEADLDLDLDGDVDRGGNRTDAVPFRAVFIRAPRVERAGPEVEVLARHEGHPVLCRQGPVVAAAFHPELSDDVAVHRWFCERVVQPDESVSDPDPRVGAGS